MKKKTLPRLLAALLAAGILSACGGASNSEMKMYSASSASADSAAPAAAQEMAAEGAGGVDSMLDPAANPSEKIIYTAHMSMESTDFDAARTALLDAVEKHGAYLQYTDQSGSAKDGDRYASYTVRVPAENYSDFLSDAGEAASVLNLSESADNITMSYIDVEARLTAFENQRDRLNALAEKAETTSDLLEIESQLSEVQYQIESYTQQLRHMDDQVNYSTVDIYLHEVMTLTPRGVTFVERLGDAFVGGWDAFIAAVQGIIISVVYLFPTLLLMAAIVAAIVLVLKAWRKKHPKPSRRPAAPASYELPKTDPGETPKPKY